MYLKISKTKCIGKYQNENVFENLKKNVFGNLEKQKCI